MRRILKNNKDLIILMSILIFIGIFLSFLTISFSFFFKSKTTGGNIILGELDFDIVVKSDNIDNVLPGDNVLISVNVLNKVKNKNNLIPFYFRYKFINKELDDNKLITVKNDDFVFYNNYYYYKHKVNVDENVALFDSINISKNLLNENTEDAYFQILIDAVQSDYGAVYEVFNDGPEEWFEIIEND